jgi:two-component system NarL family sensor kinase
MENQSNQELTQTFIVGSMVLMILAIGIIMLAVIHSKRIYKKQLAFQQLQFRHQQELLDYYISATEEERTRLASDLHDDVGTRLASLRMSINENTDQSAGTNLCTELDDIMQNVRAISHNIMPASIDLFGLGFTVTQLVESFRGKTTISFQLHIENIVEPDKKTSLAVYRILQELINNSLKHSGASVIEIHCADHHEKLRIQYSDNGRGFSPSKSTGLGLKSIENRARIINAELLWSASSNEGMSLEINIPKHDNEN